MRPLFEFSFLCDKADMTFQDFDGNPCRLLIWEIRKCWNETSFDIAKQILSSLRQKSLSNQTRIIIIYFIYYLKGRNFNQQTNNQTNSNSSNNDFSFKEILQIIKPSLKLMVFKLKYDTDMSKHIVLTISQLHNSAQIINSFLWDANYAQNQGTSIFYNTLTYILLITEINLISLYKSNINLTQRLRCFSINILLDQYSRGSPIIVSL